MNNLYPGSDLEGDARESADLRIGLKMPEITRRAMPQMSDGEIYLRLNVQKAHADASRSAIKERDRRVARNVFYR